MKKSIVFVAAFVLVSFIGSQICFAQMINYERRNRYLNKTAPAPAAPAAPAVSEPAAAKEQAATPMDTNAVLKEAVAAVNKNGSTKADSDILKEYDKNDDGMISKAEIEAIEADIR